MQSALNVIRNRPARPADNKPASTSEANEAAAAALKDIRYWETRRNPVQAVKAWDRYVALIETRNALS